MILLYNENTNNFLFIIIKLMNNNPFTKFHCTFIFCLIFNSNSLGNFYSFVQLCFVHFYSKLLKVSFQKRSQMLQSLTKLFKMTSYKKRYFGQKFFQFVPILTASYYSMNHHCQTLFSSQIIQLSHIQCFTLNYLLV